MFSRKSLMAHLKTIGLYGALFSVGFLPSKVLMGGLIAVLCVAYYSVMFFWFRGDFNES